MAQEPYFYRLTANHAMGADDDELARIERIEMGSLGYM